MVNINDFKQIGDYVYEIPSSYRKDMQVPARFYADATLLEGVKNDKSLEQLINTAALPGRRRFHQELNHGFSQQVIKIPRRHAIRRGTKRRG